MVKIGMDCCDDLLRSRIIDQYLDDYKYYLFDKETSYKEKIYYCPFCGTKLD